MSNIALTLFLAIVPIILILIFVCSKDKNKEPIKLLLQLFCLGILSCFLVIIISKGLSYIFPFMKQRFSDMNFMNVLLYSFIGVALVEETCKWVMLYFKGYNNSEFDELYDIVVYAVFVSLGFAFVENIMYVFTLGDLKTSLFRAISAIPGHACDEIFMGYYLSVAKRFQVKNVPRLERKNIILSIVVPTIIHGIYDFCLMSGLMILVAVFIIFIIALYIISLKKLKNMSLNNKKLDETVRFCRNCGSLVEGEFCSACGRQK